MEHKSTNNVNPNFCPHCGSAVSAGATFCAGCGKSLSGKAKRNIAVPIVAAIAGCLAIALIVLLVTGGLGGGGTTPQPDSVAESSGAVAADVDLSQLVTDAWSSSQGGAGASFRIPKINLDSAEIDALNAQIIQDVHTAYVEIPAGELVDETHLLSEFKSLDYSYTVVGDILSLVIKGESSYTDGTAYHVYTVSISQARPAGKAEVLAAANMDPATYEELVKQRLETEFWNYYESIVQNGVNGVSEGDVLMWADMLNRTRAQENLNTAIPYLDESGAVWIRGTVCMPIQGGQILGLYNLEGFGLSPRYGEELVYHDGI